MQNTKSPPFSTVELTLMAGLYTEASPTELPEGASPLTVNTDFQIGSVLPRPGKQSKYYYTDFFLQRDAGFGQSVPDGPNEQPWTTPNNISVHTPPAYASVTLNGAASVLTPGPFDTFIGLSSPSASFGPGSGTSTTFPFFANATGDYVVVATQWQGTISVPTITDDAGMTWSPVVAGPGFAVYLATATASAVSGCHLTVSVASAGSDATSVAYCILNNVIGLTSVLTAQGSDTSATATVNIGTLVNSTMAIKSTPVAFTEGTVCFLGTIGSVMLNFVGSAAGTLSDPGGNVNWNALAGSGAPGSLLQFWRYGGTTLPLTEFVPSFDQAVQGGSKLDSNFSVGPLTPSEANEWAFFSMEPGASTINPSWALFGSSSTDYSEIVSTSTAASGTLGGSVPWNGIMALFRTTNGLVPTIRNGNDVNQATPGLHVLTQDVTLTNPVTAGSTMLVRIRTQTPYDNTVPTITDNATPPNVYTLVQSNFVYNPGTGLFEFGIQLYISQNVGVTGLTKITAAIANTNGFASAGGQIRVVEISPLAGSAVAGEDTSEELQGLNYGFSIPSDQAVLGMQVIVGGDQTSLATDCILTLKLISPTADSPTYTLQLPASDGEQTFGLPTDNWGLALTPDLLNNPNFGLELKATGLDGTEVTFNVYRLAIKAWLTPDPAPSINYLKTFSETGGEVLNLFLGSDGVMYQEDAINLPGALTAVYTAIEPDTFGQSATQSDREFIALSNLQNGTDIPYSYNGTNFDRLSQVGPGAAPTCTASSSGSAIDTITQNAAVPLLTGNHDWLLVSDSPSDHGNFGTPSTPGNVFTLIFRSATTVPAYIKAGSNIVIAGFPAINGNVVNNDPAGITAPRFYTVTTVGQAIPGQQSYDAISFQVPFSTFYNAKTPLGCTIQATIATLTTTVQVPNLEVGGQFQVAGTGGSPPSGYDGTWLVTATPNAAQLDITSTSLTNNIATYAFVLVSGTAPAVGEAVTVTQTLNGNGIFNVANAIISSVTAGTFSVGLVNNNVSSAAEDGAGIIFGTIFQFDPFQIVGNKSGGTIVTAGIIAAGVRKCCYSFLTRNGYITQPSPIVTFDVTSGSSGIAVSNLAVGPSNVIARIVHFTAANGGNFYDIPQPVTVNDNGTNVINSSTYVLDNVTTNAFFSFSDGVLLAAAAIDIQGNNLFETAEIGAPVGVVPYAARLFIIGEQNKLTNLLNWSFDGGIGVIQSSAGAGGGTGTNSTYPLGWTVDPTNGQGGAVVASPIFGSAYQISNDTGSTQAIYGMITQPAFQDEFQVPIIQASTTYSVRVTADVTAGATGNLVVDLFDPATSRSVGTFTLPFSGIDTTMEIFTGTLLTTTLAPVPNGLLLRLYATDIIDGVTLNVDRVEIFPTEEPNLSTQVTGSYVNNFEAFDQVTGVIDASVQNQQFVKSAFTLYDTLYLVKAGSIVSTQDNGTTEPSGWQTRIVSNSVGTTSIYGVTTGIDEPNAGEEWAVIAGRAGAFIFTGGEPVKLSEEIQSLWDQINWTYGHTLWVKNDIINRRILIGVPMKVPNDWCPVDIFGTDANPTTPNVILDLNYKMLNTSGQLSERVEVHTTYAGKLVAFDVTRKWSVWKIKSPCAAFIQRANNTAPLFLGNSDHTGKIYDLVEGLLEDDGTAFKQLYTTYGFVSGEQGQGLGMGMVRKCYEYMTMVIDGTGSLTMTALLNTLDGPYGHDLLPNLTLPASVDGDVEVPINETASRLFLQFSTDAVGAGFNLSRIIMALRQDPWSPVRGMN